jgi:glucose/arabinose dehydrogenase
MAESAGATTSTGYARYIGRVGGLAFALGVGAAILSGTAVASADTSESSTGTGAPSSASSPPARGGSVSKASHHARKPASSSDTRGTASGTPDTETETVADTDTDVSSGAGVATQQDNDISVAKPTRPHRFWTAASVPNLGEITAAAPVHAVADTRATAAEPTGPFLDNVTPTITHDPSEDIAAGATIVGNLHPVDPDSSKLTYTATRPAHGTVKINSDGTFVYTPGSTYTGQDSFKVTVSDARSGFHIHGSQGLLSLLTFGLLGNSGHKTTETVFLGLQRTVVAAGLDQPVDFRILSDGRIFVAERTGAIRIVEDGKVLEQPLITLPVNSVLERGISGITLDPDFEQNGFLYVAYTTADIHDRLSRLTVVGDTAALDSEKVLFDTGEEVALYHHGGGLAFGPDGKLYWGKGDNLFAANGQDLTNVYGKILRINPDSTVPSNNPDLGPGSNPLIWAYGLRNPYRMSFTPDGKLLVADVGQSLFEELNLVTAGGNYGWPDSEGLCTRDCAGSIDPIYTYAHGVSAAITAGFLYTGSQLGANYQNKVFIADEVQGWIKVLTCNADLTSCGNPQMFDPQAGTTVALAEGLDGNLYQLVYDKGTLVRIAPPGDSSAQTSA